MLFQAHEKISFATPDTIRLYPKAALTKTTQRGRQQGKSLTLTQGKMII